VSYSDHEPESAKEGVRLVAEAVTGTRPRSASIGAGSLNVVSLPTAARGGAAREIALPIGLFLGLCLGLILLVALERADPRIDDAETLGAEASTPSSLFEGLSDDAVVALLDRWTALAGRADATIALVPVVPSAERLAAAVQQHLVTVGRREGWPIVDGFHDDEDGRRRISTALVPTGAPGGSSAGESAALAADVTVLVAADATPLRDLQSATAVLDRFGIVPRWAIYVSKPGAVQRARPKPDGRDGTDADADDARPLVRTS
jgi:hypothetical protein